VGGREPVVAPLRLFGPALRRFGPPLLLPALRGLLADARADLLRIAGGVVIVAVGVTLRRRLVPALLAVIRPGVIQPRERVRELAVLVAILAIGCGAADTRGRLVIELHLDGARIDFLFDFGKQGFGLHCCSPSGRGAMAPALGSPASLDAG
jgi:hypothetical protein